MVLLGSFEVVQVFTPLFVYLTMFTTGILIYSVWNGPGIKKDIAWLGLTEPLMTSVSKLEKISQPHII